MKKLNKSGLACYQFHLIEGFSEDIDHAVFARSGGVSLAPYNSLNVRFKIGDKDEAVKENRRRVMKAMKLNYCLSADQTHSCNVVVVDEKMNEKIFGKTGVSGGSKTVEIGDVDGFVTNRIGIGMMIQVADCQAILFYDPGLKILGVAHAGWRGLKNDISGRVIEEMVRLGANPAHILVGISPALGPANSEFTDPLKELGLEFEPFIKKRYVDLWEFSKRQLMGHGVEERRIEVARLDTADAEIGAKFFSHRREKGKTGRFALVAVLR